MKKYIVAGCLGLALLGCGGGEDKAPSVNAISIPSGILLDRNTTVIKGIVADISSANQSTVVWSSNLIGGEFSKPTGTVTDYTLPKSIPADISSLILTLTVTDKVNGTITTKVLNLPFNTVTTTSSISSSVAVSSSSSNSSTTSSSVAVSSSSSNSSTTSSLNQAPSITSLSLADPSPIDINSTTVIKNLTASVYSDDNYTIVWKSNLGGGIFTNPTGLLTDYTLPKPIPSGITSVVFTLTITDTIGQTATKNVTVTFK